MTFRVLSAGGRHFTDYPLPRATLDSLLAYRLPDVELLTSGGPSVPMLGASDATERQLGLTALMPDLRRFSAKGAGRGLARAPRGGSMAPGSSPLMRVPDRHIRVHLPGLRHPNHRWCYQRRAPRRLPDVRDRGDGSFRVPA